MRRYNNKLQHLLLPLTTVFWYFMKVRYFGVAFESHD